MSLRLKVTSQFAAGGYAFTDPKTGMKFAGMEGMPPFQADRIIAHRRANPKIYPSGEGHWFNKESVIQEVLAQKFAVMPWLFVGQADRSIPLPGQQPKTSQVIIGDKCSCGGTEYVPRHCSSCSGRKILGYTCSSCGKERRL